MSLEIFVRSRNTFFLGKYGILVMTSFSIFQLLRCLLHDFYGRANDLLIFGYTIPCPVSIVIINAVNSISKVKRMQQTLYQINRHMLYKNTQLNDLVHVGKC